MTLNERNEAAEARRHAFHVGQRVVSTHRDDAGRVYIVTKLGGGWHGIGSVDILTDAEDGQMPFSIGWAPEAQFRPA